MSFSKSAEGAAIKKPTTSVVSTDAATSTATPAPPYTPTLASTSIISGAFDVPSKLPSLSNRFRHGNSAQHSGGIRPQRSLIGG